MRESTGLWKAQRRLQQHACTQNAGATSDRLRKRSPHEAKHLHDARQRDGHSNNLAEHHRYHRTREPAIAEATHGHRSHSRAHLVSIRIVSGVGDEDRAARIPVHQHRPMSACEVELGGPLYPCCPHALQQPACLHCTNPEILTKLLTRCKRQPGSRHRPRKSLS